jgi:hypothetical protein
MSKKSPVSVCSPLIPLILFLGAAVTSLAFSAARGAPVEGVSYDFLSKQMIVHGYYVPKQGETKTGLAAELEARQNGIEVLGRHIGKACADGTANPRIASGWKGSLRSQGSEIFSNGVLRIILTANLKDVYRTFGSSKARNLKTPEGESIAFRLPSLPQGAISCGTVKVELFGKKYAAAPVLLGDDAGAKTIGLLLGGGGVLKVSSPEDASLLEKAKFSEEALSEGDVLALPVVGG